MEFPLDTEILRRYIENPATTTENQTPPHAPIVPYRTITAAHEVFAGADTFEKRRERSSLVASLDGEWAFHWGASPTDAPRSLASVEDWDQIRVPATWQTEGHGRVVYRNQALDWAGVSEVDEGEIDPPGVPWTHNPVGTYRRTIKVPPEWLADRRALLRFEGVKSAFFVWIDGEYVGYGQGSKTPAEFDATDALGPGENEVVVQVYRYSDGTYLESQDMLRFSGIFRSVSLTSVPEVSLQDFTVNTEFRDDDTGILAVETDVGAIGGGSTETGGRLQQARSESSDAADSTDTTADTSNRSVRVHLLDPDGDPVTAAESGVGDIDGTDVVGTTETTTLAVDSPQRWSAEHPALYTLVIELQVDGETSVAIPWRVGFREWTVADGQLRLNGSPVEIRGANRHEHDPENGRAVPSERTREDLCLLKRHNFNAIRTAHYPNDLSVYALADEYGVYVLDEANVETHYDVEFVDDNPDFHEAFRERFRWMVERDRNFTSVFAWSTGNEAGTGSPHEDMATYARSADGTRPVVHQGNGEAPYAEHTPRSTGTAPFADVAGIRYPEPDLLKDLSDLGETRPVVMGEYSHAMGNSLGLHEAYWRVVRECDRVQGGFVWEWCDQSLTRADGVASVEEDGNDGETETHQWYDGDPSLLDGLVSARRESRPTLRHAKACQQPIEVEPVKSERGVVAITNHHAFTDLDAFDLAWSLTTDGRPVEEGVLNRSVPPGGSRDVTIPLDAGSLIPGGEHHLTISVRRRERTGWAPPGHEVAVGQVPVSGPDETIDSTDGSDRRATSDPFEEKRDGTVRETSNRIVVSNGEHIIKFDREGRVTLRLGDRIACRGGPDLSAWRAPVMNECGAIGEWGHDEAADWRRAGLDRLSRLTDEFRVTTENGVIVETESRFAPPDGPPLFRTTTTYTPLEDGGVAVAATIEPTDALRKTVEYLPQVGHRFRVADTFDRFEWFGRGPDESYPDRTAATTVGTHECRFTAAEVTGLDATDVPYLPPQTFGTVTDVRRATVHDGTIGLAVANASEAAVTVDRYANLDCAARSDDLRRRDHPVVHVLVGVSGVGDTPIQLPASHRVPVATATFEYVLRPVALADSATRVFRRRS